MLDRGDCTGHCHRRDRRDGRKLLHADHDGRQLILGKRSAPRYAGDGCGVLVIAIWSDWRIGCNGGPAIVQSCADCGSDSKECGEACNDET